MSKTRHLHVLGHGWAVAYTSLFLLAWARSASMASTVSEIEGSKSDEQLDEKLQSDEEVQSSEAFSEVLSIRLSYA